MESGEEEKEWKASISRSKMTSRAKERKKKKAATLSALLRFPCSTSTSLTFLLHLSQKPFQHTQLPGDAKLSYFDAENTMQEISVDELTRGKRVGELVLVLVFGFCFSSLFVVPKNLANTFFSSLLLEHVKNPLCSDLCRSW